MRPHQSYQRINVSTADPVRMVVLLYEGAVKNLNQALNLMGQDNDGAGAKINRALEIINYLRSSLNHEQGGEIADNLERLYEYMRDTLALANIQSDKEKIQHVIGLLQTLLEGWRGIISNQTSPDVEADAPSPPSQPLNLSLVG